MKIFAFHQNTLSPKRFSLQSAKQLAVLGFRGWGVARGLGVWVDDRVQGFEDWG